MRDPLSLDASDLLVIAQQGGPQIAAHVHDLRMRASPKPSLETKAAPAAATIRPIVSPQVQALRTFLDADRDAGIRSDLAVFRHRLHRKELALIAALAADGYSEADLAAVLEFAQAEHARLVEDERARLLAGARAAR